MENGNVIPPEPVTAMLVRQLLPGRERDFENWTTQMEQVVKQFPGWLGTDVIRPRDANHPEYLILVRFSDVDHLKGFMDSADRAELIKKSEEFNQGEVTLHEQHGMTSFFDVPGNTKNLGAPAKYKMAVLTLLVLYPFLIGISSGIAVLFKGIPRPLSVLFTLFIVVPLMTWVLMPAVTRLFRKWLFGIPR